MGRTNTIISTRHEQITFDRAQSNVNLGDPQGVVLPKPTFPMRMIPIELSDTVPRSVRYSRRVTIGRHLWVNALLTVLFFRIYLFKLHIPMMMDDNHMREMFMTSTTEFLLSLTWMLAVLLILYAMVESSWRKEAKLLRAGVASVAYVVEGTVEKSHQVHTYPVVYEYRYQYRKREKTHRVTMEVGKDEYMDLTGDGRFFPVLYDPAYPKDHMLYRSIGAATVTSRCGARITS